MDMFNYRRRENNKQGFEQESLRKRPNRQK